MTEFITLDGVVDSPGNGEHPHAGWTFRDVERVDEMYELKAAEQESATALLLGRVTYEEFAPVWPKLPEFETYNAMPKYVVSTTLNDPEWTNTTVLRSLDDVRALKEGTGGDILVHGSATLAKHLAAAGLVDRYNLLVFPVLLGAGKRLFDDSADAHRRLRLVEHAIYRNGVAKLCFDVIR